MIAKAASVWQGLGLAALATAFGAAVLLLGPWEASPPPEPRPGWQVITPPHDVNALALRDGIVFAGGRDGLLAFDQDTGAARPFAAHAPSMSYVKALLVDGADQLWVGHRRGIAIEADGVWHVISTDYATAPGPVAALVETPDGRILAGGEAGLAAVEDGAIVTGNLLPPDVEGGQVLALLIDSRQQLWVGLAAIGRGGLLLRDAHGWQHFGIDDGLVHPAINALFEDAAGNLHLAAGFARRGGACRQATLGDPSRWHCIGAPDGLTADMVRVVHEDRHGQVWYGSEFSGTTVLRDGLVRHFPPGDGLPGPELKAVLEDSSGNLWLGTDRGLVRVEAAHTKLFDPSSGDTQ